MRVRRVVAVVDAEVGGGAADNGRIDRGDAVGGQRHVRGVPELDRDAVNSHRAAVVNRRDAGVGGPKELEMVGIVGQQMAVRIEELGRHLPGRRAGRRQHHQRRQRAHLGRGRRGWQGHHQRDHRLRPVAAAGDAVYGLEGRAAPIELGGRGDLAEADLDRDLVAGDRDRAGAAAGQASRDIHPTAAIELADHRANVELAAQRSVWLAGGAVAVGVDQPQVGDVVRGQRQQRRDVAAHLHDEAQQSALLLDPGREDVAEGLGAGVGRVGQGADGGPAFARAVGGSLSLGGRYAAWRARSLHSLDSRRHGGVVPSGKVENIGW